MKSRLLTLFILILIPSILPILSSSFSYSANLDSNNRLRKVENNAFGLGEVLEYDIVYGWITAGKGSFRIMPETIEIEGRACFDVRYEVRNVKSLEWLYKVRDVYLTKIDTNGIFPWEYEQHIREGSYRRDVITKFDQINHKAFAGKDTFDIKDYVQDIASAMYYLRTFDFAQYKKGDIISLYNFYKDSTYSLDVRVHSREEIEVEAGTFKTIRIEPLVQKGGLFKNDGSIIIWLTDDERKLPILVESKVFIGSIGVELVKYSGLKGKVDAKIE
jgi:Protein of unknown function (DUF3108)